MRSNESAELAKKLANPVASLISFPIKLSYDQDIGPARDGERTTLTIQPVIPFDLNEDWNLVSRTVLPIVWQDQIFPGAGDQSGTGDTVQSLFFSPKAPTDSGWIWGAGPVFLLPTGSDDLLGADKWGLGPTAVALKQDGGWTYGGLTNHIWSVVGDDDRTDVSSTFVQPFLSYTTPDAWSYGITSEGTYDWKSKQWTVPVSASAKKVVNFGQQLAQVGGELRYWADTPDGGPHGWGIGLNLTLLFPK